MYVKLIWQRWILCLWGLDHGYEVLDIIYITRPQALDLAMLMHKYRLIISPGIRWIKEIERQEQERQGKERRKRCSEKGKESEKKKKEEETEAQKQRRLKREQEKEEKKQRKEQERENKRKEGEEEKEKVRDAKKAKLAWLHMHSFLYVPCAHVYFVLLISYDRLDVQLILRLPSKKETHH